MRAAAPTAASPDARPARHWHASSCPKGTPAAVPTAAPPDARRALRRRISHSTVPRSPRWWLIGAARDGHARPRPSRCARPATAIPAFPRAVAPSVAPRSRPPTARLAPSTARAVLVCTSTPPVPHCLCARSVWPRAAAIARVANHFFRGLYGTQMRAMCDSPTARAPCPHSPSVPISRTTPHLEARARPYPSLVYFPWLIVCCLTANNMHCALLIAVGFFFCV